jgi:hypothetical protein
MRNIQVVDGADNCTFDIFSVDDQTFNSIFPSNGQDIEFAEDFVARVGEEYAAATFAFIWERRVDKKVVEGIHGTLFFELTSRKDFYPTKKESEMVVVL